VQLLTCITFAVRCRPRGDIRRDRIVPETQTRENMRGHMQRVGSGGGDLRVSARGRQAAWRQLRAVISVNQIMRNARVVRMVAINRLQDRRRALLVRMGSVFSRSRRDERQRIEDLCFGVRRIVPRRQVHPFLMSFGANRMRRMFGVAIKSRSGCNELPLPLRSDIQLHGPGDFRSTLAQVVRARWGPQLVPIRHGHAPMRHGAGWIGRGDVTEGFL
jgi:hypothetical protein